MNGKTIDPGEGYRLLEAGEAINQADQYLIKIDGKLTWALTGDAGFPSPGNFHRRKVESATPTTAPESEHIAKECGPDAGKIYYKEAAMPLVTVGDAKLFLAEGNNLLLTLQALPDAIEAHREAFKVAAYLLASGW